MDVNEILNKIMNTSSNPITHGLLAVLKLKVLVIIPPWSECVSVTRQSA